MTRAADLEPCHLPRPLGFSGTWPLPGASPLRRRAREPDGLFFRVVRIFRDGGATDGRYGEVVSAPYYFEADETPCYQVRLYGSDGLLEVGGSFYRLDELVPSCGNALVREGAKRP